MSLEELMELLSERKTVVRKAARKMAVSKPKRALTPWQRFLRDFTFRKRRKNESSSAYLSARSKAASKAWKKKNKGSTKKGMVRKTARRAYER